MKEDIEIKSMNYYEELRRCEQQIARKKSLVPTIKLLKDRYYALEEKVAELGQKKIEEDKDLKRIEGRSLARFFYGVVGKRDEKLTKERKEAEEATAMYNVACKELESLKREIRQKEEELFSYQNSEQRYGEILKEYTSAVKKMGGERSKRVIELDEQIVRIEAAKKEVSEARQAGESALDIANYILKDLDGARKWGIYDVLGGGAYTAVQKYDYIGRAERDIRSLQVQLSRFKTELADVQELGNIGPVTDNFHKFADIVFDGLIFDYKVLNQIGSSADETKETIAHLKGILHKLELAESKIATEELALKMELSELLEANHQKNEQNNKDNNTSEEEASEKGSASLKLRNMTSIYLKNGDKYLMLYRIGSKVVNDSYTGTAGGHFEENELNNPKACVLRELYEETGLISDDIENLQLRYITIRRLNGEIRQNYFYFADLKDVNKQIISNEGELQWFDRDELTSLEMPFTAKYAVEHYVKEGICTDAVYAGVATDSGVTFIRI